MRCQLRWQRIRALLLLFLSQAGTEGSTVSSLICDRWLIITRFRDAQY